MGCVRVEGSIEAMFEKMEKKVIKWREGIGRTDSFERSTYVEEKAKREKYFS
jgi:hypothetical protein